MLNLLPQPKNELYLNRYKKLIAYASTQSFIGYTEKHHILPKCMFPEHIKTKENLVVVSARIHFLLHYLLWKAYRTSQVWNAFKFMNSKSSNHTRYLNSKLYASLKQSKTKGTRKPHSEQSKEKMRLSKLGKSQSVTHVQNRANSLKGKPANNKWTAESRVKLSESRNNEKCKTSSKTNLQKANELVMCPHCSKCGNLGNMIRWHFDNCKQK